MREQEPHPARNDNAKILREIQEIEDAMSTIDRIDKPVYQNLLTTLYQQLLDENLTDQHQGPPDSDEDMSDSDEDMSDPDEDPTDQHQGTSHSDLEPPRIDPLHQELSPDEVIALISASFPDLSPASPDIAELLRSIKEHMQTAPPLYIPEIVESPSTWPSTNVVVDALWAEVTRDECRVPLPSTPTTGLDMRPDYLVKPFGSPEDPLMVISSYPTSDPTSSLHMSYSTVNDMSNQSIAVLLIKLGYNVANVRTTGVFMVDFFPRRLDRKRLTGNSEKPLDSVPSQLRHYWQTHAFICLDKSTARVLLVVGGIAFRDYCQYLKERGRTAKVLYLSGTERYKGELPGAMLEYYDTSPTTVRRIAIITFHPEGFKREKSHTKSSRDEDIAIREQLIDYALTIVYGQPNVQGFLSTSAYHFNLRSGTLVRKDIIAQGGSALSSYLKLPLTFKDALDAFRNAMKTIKMPLSKDAMARIRVLLMDCDEALTWLNRPELQAIYGPYLATYKASVIQTEDMRVRRGLNQVERVEGRHKSEDERESLRKALDNKFRPPARRHQSVFD
ncbi:hypothetical protein J4E93_000336 [Alternaria ventricosa]|uniref:uncharacterized protein n=1 Tax=Alternaria ventricosa TaxID=1187951 RepID=UPI0020C49BD1|nr:uncharacterized protein J4E93_000336 [Alternaria ventricosa]KAI4655622.1 hypothetical protein J4E93_000336 [Alternaria ventricosa]